MMAALKFILRLLRLILSTPSLFIAALLLAAIGYVLYLFRTPQGHARIERWLVSRLPSQVHIEGLGGRLPFAGRLSMVRLQDAKGSWLEARDLEWELDPGALLSAVLRFHFIRVGDVAISRPPETYRGRRPDSPTSKDSPECLGLAGSTESLKSPEAPESLASRDSPAPSLNSHSEPDVLLVKGIECNRLLIGNGFIDGSVFSEPVTLQAKGGFTFTPPSAVAPAAWKINGMAQIVLSGHLIRLDGGIERLGNEGLLDIRRLSGEGFEIWGQGNWSPAVRFRFGAVFTNPPLLRAMVPPQIWAEGRVTGSYEGNPTPTAAFHFALASLSVGAVSNLSIEGEGNWTSSEGVKIFASRAQAPFSFGTVSVERATLIYTGAGDVTWNAESVEYRQIHAITTGRWSRTQFEAWARVPRLAVTNTPLGQWFRGGFIEAELLASGSAEHPYARARVTGEELDVRLAGAYAPRPAALALFCEASNGFASIEASWSGWTAEPITAAARLPFWLGEEGRFGLDPEGPLSGKLHIALSLENIGRWTDLRGGEMAGHLKGNVEVYGTWNQPLARGRIELEDGRAVFADSGTLLQNVRIIVEGHQDGFEIREAAGDDGAGGRVTARGRVLFDPVNRFPIEALIELDRFQVWRDRRSLLRLSGFMHINGSAFSPIVTGELQIAQAEIRLRPSPPPIPRLPLEDGEVAVEAAAANEQSWLHHLAIDVSVRGRNILIAGRGLDSTWRAEGVVRGPADQLSIRGIASVERGYFLFLGRRFTLDRAVISLDGRRPPQPLIDVSATSHAGDMRASLYATGPLEAPTLTLESEPAYPPEEILSRLLFGRSAETITPLQAVRLAHGLNLLRGQGNSLDILERGQSLLRVDQLEIVQSDSDSGVSAISVGKYVGRNVYIEGEKSFDHSADLITVEVELTPSLILTTESSPRIREGIGIKWRRDF